MLIDSGSTRSFLNSRYSSQLVGVEAMSPVAIKVADGAHLISHCHIPRCYWQYQGSTFCTCFRFLSLGHYDGILGLDWLASLGPMGVDWGVLDGLQFNIKGTWLLLGFSSTGSQLFSG
jgi:hypothetical protein